MDGRLNLPSWLTLWQTVYLSAIDWVQGRNKLVCQTKADILTTEPCCQPLPPTSPQW